MEVLRTRTLEIIYDLFIWEEADFEFFDSEPLPDDLIRIQVDATSVIMDGIYRIDEWARYRRVIPSERTFFALNIGWTQSLEQSKEVREILYHVEKRMTAAEICYNMHTSLFHASALLFNLVEKGVIKVAGEAPPPEVQDLVALKLPETVPELLKLARAEMKDNNIENALAIINSALDQDPKSNEANRLREDAEKRFIVNIHEIGIGPQEVSNMLERYGHIEQHRLGQ